MFAFNRDNLEGRAESEFKDACSESRVDAFTRVLAYLATLPLLR